MKLGMVGLGVMGQGIAPNIIRGGHELIVYDLRPEAMEAMTAQGAKAVSSLQELGKQVDTVLMIVNAYQHCCSVLDGLLETMHRGTIINMSTIALADAKQLASRVQACGVAMMDCPVSGGTAGARAGTLTVMASGERELFERYLPVFESFGSHVVHVGTEIGQGQALKAINQLLVGVHMCATAEAFTLARMCGLNLQMVYDTICKSAGQSRIFENRGQFLINRDFSTRSTLQIQLKDTDIVCKTADIVGAPVLLANTARELFKLAVNKYPPNDDSLEVVRLYEELCSADEA